MANVEHSVLTGAALHEPKGIAAVGSTPAAPSGTVYVSNGSNTGTWRHIHRYAAAYTSFSSSSPYPYTLATGTTEVPLSPPITSTATGFTVATNPLKFTYTDVSQISALINITMSSSHTQGSSRNVEWALFHNGSEIVGSRAIRTINSGTWGSISVTGLKVLNQNDFIEIKTKANATVDVDYANIYVSIIGMST